MGVQRPIRIAFLALIVSTGSSCTRTPTSDPSVDGPSRVAGSNRTVEPASLRFDGMYCSKVPVSLANEDHPNSKETYSNYFRFYADGRFAYTASTGKPSDVAQWIQPEPLGAGMYRRKGDQIALDFPNQPAHDPNAAEWLEWVGILDGDEIEFERYENTKNPKKRELINKERLVFVATRFGHQ